jgi:hypothetical protein
VTPKVRPTYPGRNPFPPLATVTVEGRANFSLAGTPTAQRQPIERIVNLVDRYLEDDPIDRAGRAVALHGEHGSGKTHTLLVALARVVARSADDAPRSPLALYVRADSPEPLALYRKLMTQLALPELARLVEDAFAGYAADAFTSVRTDASDDSAGIAEQMRANPGVVLEAIRVKELSWSDAVGQQEADIERIQKQYGKFDRVARSLLEPTLATTAHMWLSGGELERDDLKRLGVEGNIEEATDATLALHVLAALARAARRPFVLVVDQVEALVETTDGEPVAGNPGWLRALLEAVSSEAGFFVAAISERAWKRLPPDLPMRFGPSEIPVRGLTVDEAEAVVAACLAPWHIDAQKATPVYPFERDGIRALLVVSGGNIRRFLQACRLVFDRAAPEQAAIGSTLVVEASEGISQRAPSEAEVRQAVERVLGSRSVGYVADHRVGGRIVHYALLRGGRTALIVQLQEALFAKDEAESAVANLETIRAAQELRVPIVLVVLGYSSPEVTTKLEEAAARVLVADDMEFERDLKRAVGEALDDQSAQSDLLEQRLEELRVELARLAERRGEEENVVSERLRSVTEEMAETQRVQQLQTYRQAWSQERQRLEDEINRVRAERKRSDVAQMVELHSVFYDRRRARQRLFVIAVGLFLTVSAVVALAILGSGGVSTAVIVAVIGGLAALVALSLFALWRDGTTADTTQVRTLEDVDRRAREARGLAGIQSPDPYGRYAAAQSADARELPIGFLLEAVEREPAGLVRRRLVASVVERGPEAVTTILEARVDPATMSIAVEAWARAVRYQPYRNEEVPRLLPDRLQLLAAVWGAAATDDPFLDDFLGYLHRDFPGAARWDEGESPGLALARAFEKDDDELLARAVGDVPDRLLRRTTALLSPLDGEGLGSWYWLERIGEVDDLFLFFRKAAFLAASGIRAPQPTAP